MKVVQRITLAMTMRGIKGYAAERKFQPAIDMRVQPGKTKEATCLIMQFLAPGVIVECKELSAAELMYTSRFVYIWRSNGRP